MALSERTKDYIAIGLLFIGAIADCESTRYFLSLGYKEANPLAVYFISILGMFGLYLLKALSVAGMLVWLRLWPTKRIYKQWGMALGGIVWLIVAAFNILGTAQ